MIIFQSGKVTHNLKQKKLKSKSSLGLTEMVSADHAMTAVRCCSILSILPTLYRDCISQNNRGFGQLHKCQ